ncbi:hypothetical protein ACH3X8_01590 [Streptomyces sp. WSLK1-4]|uniref:hypothetical protein n=1 Tax=Streptomyces sp. WSLK1-5 TaxID=3375473 RepID=UPI00379C0F57
MIPGILRLVGALQTSDRDGVSCPANWHPGEDVVLGAPRPGRTGGPVDRRQRQTHRLVPGDEARHTILTRHGLAGRSHRRTAWTSASRAVQLPPSVSVTGRVTVSARRMSA